MSPTEKPARTVLVVEDEPQVRSMIRLLLHREGFQVLEAGSGQHALALSRAHTGAIDLAIIDLGMPVMGGFDLANRLLPERPSTKVLYISGMIGSVAMASLVQASPRLIVSKPFTTAELLNRINEILGSTAA